MSDTRTYARTLTKLELLNPVEILVPLGALSGESAACGGGAGSGPSTLYRDLKEVCPGTTLTQVQRKYFSETRGLAEIRDATFGPRLSYKNSNWDLTFFAWVTTLRENFSTKSQLNLADNLSENDTIFARYEIE